MKSTRRDENGSDDETNGIWGRGIVTETTVEVEADNVSSIDARERGMGTTPDWDAPHTVARSLP